MNKTYLGTTYSMCEIVSSNLTHAGYDPLAQSMAVTFKSGFTYVYFGVSQEVYDLFLVAGSKGSFFAKNIKNVFGFKKA